MPEHRTLSSSSSRCPAVRIVSHHSSRPLETRWSAGMRCVENITQIRRRTPTAELIACARCTVYLREEKNKNTRNHLFFSWQYKDNEIWRRFGKENQKTNCILARLSSPSRAITMYWFRLGEDNHKHHAGKGQNKEMNREPRRKAVSCEFWPCYQTVPKDYHPTPAVHTMHGTAQQSLQILTFCAWHSVKTCIFGGIHTSNRRTCFISMFTSLSFSEKYHQVPEI